jgi:hypothetical protein
VTGGHDAVTAVMTKQSPHCNDRRTTETETTPSLLAVTKNPYGGRVMAPKLCDCKTLTSFLGKSSLNKIKQTLFTLYG